MTILPGQLSDLGTNSLRRVETSLKITLIDSSETCQIIVMNVWLPIGDLQVTDIGLELVK